MSDLDKFRKVLKTLDCEYNVFLEVRKDQFEITVYSMDSSLGNAYMGSIYFNLDGSLKDDYNDISI